MQFHSKNTQLFFFEIGYLSVTPKAIVSATIIMAVIWSYNEEKIKPLSDCHFAHRKK